jgi:PAS domain S-box-containing protein
MLAPDGEQALAAALRQPPDLVVTDLMMPRLAGDHLVLAMRAEPSLSDVPVLVLSARDDEALRAELLSQSVQDFVTKPFSAQELRARVRNLAIMKLTRDALRRALASQGDDLAQLAHDLIANRRALQASEQRWAAMYEHSPVGIALAAEDGQLLSANPAFCTMLGYALRDLQAVTLQRVTPVEDRASAQVRLAQVLSGEQREVHLLRRFQHREGRLVWANTSVSRVPGDADCAPFLIVVAEDVTERRSVEEALGRTRSELARVARVSTLGELAASIAHEVNQPMAAIVANGHACMRWMGTDATGDAEARAAVTRIIRDANHASAVITRVRRFLRRGDLLREPVNVALLVDEVLDMVRKEAVIARVALLFEPPPELPVVSADRVQVQQIVLNLVMNAMEAIQAHPPSARWVEVGVGAEGAEAVRVDVRDGGPGIDARDVDRVFDAFHTTKPGGLGMGLAISRTIVEAHGGRLWVSAPRAPGATFSFTLSRDAG